MKTWKPQNAPAYKVVHRSKSSGGEKPAGKMLDKRGRWRNRPKAQP